MKLHNVSTACSICLIFIGCIVMYGWTFHIPIMLQAFPGSIGMVFNTATLFLATGILLFICSQPIFRYQTLLRNLLSGFIFAFALLSLVQDLIPFKIQIDTLFVTPWLNDSNPTPGRMAPNSALAFMLTGVIGLLLPYGNKKSVGLTIKLLTFFIFLIALLGLLIYSLKLEYVLAWYSSTRMAIITAIGFLFVSIGWVAVWRQTEWYKNFYKKHDEHKIIFIIGSILVSLTLIGALASVATLTYFNIKSVEETFLNTLKNKINFFETSINHSIDSLNSKEHITTLTELVQNTNKTTQTDAIKQETDFLISKGFSAFILKDLKGNILFKNGNFIQNPDLTTTLNLAYKTLLFWKNGYWLQFTIPIYADTNKTPIAYLYTQIPLTAVTEFIHQSQTHATEKVLLCYKIDDQTAKCFPTIKSIESSNISLTHANKPTPIYYALQGQQGILNYADENNNKIIAAYGPIQNSTLGLVNLMDATELYQVIHHQLRFIFPAVLFFILCGLFLLRWQISPLVKKVIQSELDSTKTKKRLEESEERFELAINSSRTGLWDWNVNTNEAYYSPQYKELLGYSNDEFEPLFSSFENALHPDDKQKTLDLFRNSASSKSFFTTEFRLKQKCGLYRWFEAIGQGFGKKENKDSRMAGSLRDITERKEIEKMKNEFISIVSHELRTPLTSIHGSIALLASQILTPLPQKIIDLLKIAKNNTERLIRLFNDILDIEKIESGKLVLDIQPVEVSKLIIEAIALSENFAAKSSVKLKFTNTLPGLKIKVDHERILQVLTNLISNAIKFSNENSDVTIAVSILPNNFIRVSISDTGKGIPASFKTRVFQKFSQVDSSATRKKSGTGLGLSLCKSIVEKLGGNIDFASAEGIGSSFYFDFPIWFDRNVTATEMPVVRPIIAEKNSSQSTHFKILHIEDESETSILLASFLGASGTVTNAKTIQEAKHELFTQNFDLVVLDIMLPDGSGATLLTYIHQLNIPVIVFSAFELPNDLKHLVGHAFIKSKTSHEALLKVIKTVLLNKRA